MQATLNGSNWYENISMMSSRELFIPSSRCTCADASDYVIRS